MDPKRLAKVLMLGATIYDHAGDSRESRAEVWMNVGNALGEAMVYCTPEEQDWIEKFLDGTSEDCEEYHSQILAEEFRCSMDDKRVRVKLDLIEDRIDKELAEFQKAGRQGRFKREEGA